jgi:hypothetical protein
MDWLWKKLAAKKTRVVAIAQRGHAMPAAVALGLRAKAPGRLHKLDPVIDELDRDLEPRRRRPVRDTLRNMVHDPLPKLYRMRFIHR